MFDFWCRDVYLNNHNLNVSKLRGKELPAVPLAELYARNIKRYLATGKYIPIATLNNFLNNANDFLYPHGSVNSGGYCVSDRTLCSYAGFVLDQNTCFVKAKRETISRQRA